MKSPWFVSECEQSLVVTPSVASNRVLVQYRTGAHNEPSILPSSAAGMITTN